MTADARAASLRLDKWLWQARFAKSRTIAAAAADEGRVRLNGQPALKAHQPVRVGDVLTISIGNRIRAVRVLGLGVQRGPAGEAAALYEELGLAPAHPALEASCSTG